MHCEIDTLEVLSWMHLHDVHPVDVAAGGLLFGAAFIGALVTLYVTSPDDLPSIGGDQDVRELRSDLLKYRRAQAASLDQWEQGGYSENELAVFRARESFLASTGDLLARARRSLWRRVVPIFLAVGPAAGLTFSATVWQAVLIGSVGPATLSAIVAAKQTGSVKAESRAADAEMSDGVKELRRRVREAEAREKAATAKYENSLRAVDLMKARARG